MDIECKHLVAVFIDIHPHRHIALCIPGKVRNRTVVQVYIFQRNGFAAARNGRCFVIRIVASVLFPVEGYTVKIILIAHYGEEIYRFGCVDILDISRKSVVGVNDVGKPPDRYIGVAGIGELYCPVDRVVRACRFDIYDGRSSGGRQTFDPFCDTGNDLTAAKSDIG